MEVKTSNFNADFDTLYLVDTSAGNITVTLPNPSGNNTRSAMFLNVGANKVILSGYVIDGVSNPKLVSKGDHMHLIVYGDVFTIGMTHGYYSAAPKMWKITVDSDGVISTTDVTI